MTTAITRALRGWIGVGVAVIAGAAATLLVLGLAGAMPGLDTDGGPSGGTLDGSRLITSGRDRLAICVEAVGMAADAADASEASGKDAVGIVISNFATNHPDWASRSLSNPPPLVEIGCPATPSLYDLQAGPVDKEHLSTVLGRTVSEASYYSVFVYILPDDEIDRVLGGSRLRLATEERVCEIDVCTEVTVGVYVAESEINNSQLLSENLAPAVGLRPAP